MARGERSDVQRYGKTARKTSSRSETGSASDP
jgi:hypothetical protein